MTTIVYHDGVIAYDSRLTQGDMIATDNADKHRRVNGIDFFFSGVFKDYDDVINRYFDPNHDVSECDECEILIWTKKDLRLAVIRNGVYEDHGVQPLDIPLALGNGREYAIGAIDAGAWAFVACTIAKNRNMYTGGRIRKFHIY